MKRNNRGSSLFATLIIISVIVFAFLAIIFVADLFQPFAQRRNSQRYSDVITLSNRITERLVTGNGRWNCNLGSLPLTDTVMGNLSPDQYDMADCLVPSYFPKMPVDPVTGFRDIKAVENSDPYFTDYTVVQHQNGRITVSAPSAELGEIISTSR